jgi:hypothetical protein
MRGNSRSSRFRDLFETALRDYEQTTSLTLAEHLQNCHSVESITIFLQDKAGELGDFQGSNQIMKSIKITVSILSMLSATTALGDVHLVCPRAPMRGVPPLILILQSLPPAKAIYTGIAILLVVCPLFFRSYARTLLTLKCNRRRGD